jgi:hypothetical protein
MVIAIEVATTSYKTWGLVVISPKDHIATYGTHNEPVEKELGATSELNQDLVAHGHCRRELQLAFHGHSETD